MSQDSEVVKVSGGARVVGGTINRLPLPFSPNVSFPISQDKLMKLFAKHEFYTLDDLSQLTQQPKVWGGLENLWGIC